LYVLLMRTLKLERVFKFEPPELIDLSRLNEEPSP
jgi:hypothetical protein